MSTSAIEEVMEGKLSSRKVADKYNVKPSSLESHMKKIRSKPADRRDSTPRSFNFKYTSCQVFSVEESFK